MYSERHLDFRFFPVNDVVEICFFRQHSGKEDGKDFFCINRALGVRVSKIVSYV